MISEILLTLINIIHILYILFVVLVPFTNSNYFLLLHAIIIPFMMFHWIINNNMCFLTLVERYIRIKNGLSVSNEECFTCRLIEPVYDFEKNNKSSSEFIYIVTISLWLMSVFKLYKKYRNGEVTSLTDLTKI
jgi:hypothetical protein